MADLMRTRWRAGDACETIFIWGLLAHSNRRENFQSMNETPLLHRSWTVIEAELSGDPKWDVDIIFSDRTTWELHQREWHFRLHWNIFTKLSYAQLNGAIRNHLSMILINRERDLEWLELCSNIFFYFVKKSIVSFNLFLWGSTCNTLKRSILYKNVSENVFTCNVIEYSFYRDLHPCP